DVAALRGALAQLGAVDSGTFAAVTADIEFYRRLVVASHASVLVWTFNTFARIFAQLGERYPELWKVDRAYVDALDEVVRALVAGHQEKARTLMHDLLTRRSGVVLTQLAPQPLQELGRRSRRCRWRAAAATSTAGCTRVGVSGATSSRRSRGCACSPIIRMRASARASATPSRRTWPTSARSGCAVMLQTFEQITTNNHN